MSRREEAREAKRMEDACTVARWMIQNAMGQYESQRTSGSDVYQCTAADAETVRSLALSYTGPSLIAMHMRGAPATSTRLGDAWRALPMDGEKGKLAVLAAAFEFEVRERDEWNARTVVPVTVCGPCGAVYPVDAVHECTGEESS